MPTENECRTCGHPWEVHDHHGMKRCFQNMGEDYDSYKSFCDCNTGWIPGDNLEFLEHEYRKRGIKDVNKFNL